MPASHTPLSERDLHLLSAYLDGELADREQRALEERLAHDAALRSELDQLRDTVALVRDLPRLKAPRHFTLDPAVYGRKVLWWQRMLTLDAVLQLSGALGAAASIAIIILAVVLGSRSTAEKTEGQPAAGSEAAFAITNAQPTSLATLLTAEGTSIAYGGEGLFQATMAMQSTFYAGTPVPSPTAVPSVTAPVLLPAGTPTGAVGQVQAGLHAGPSEETSMADNAPLTESTATAQPSVAEAPAPLTASEPSVLGAAAQPVPALPGASAPLSSPEGETGAAPAPQAAVPGQGAFREGSGSGNENQAATPTPEAALEQAVAPTWQEPSATPPESPTASVAAPTATAVPLEVAQAPGEQDNAFKTVAEQPATEQGEARNLGWLVGLGVALLVVSTGLFLAGRRRARRA
jgi:hypothetical protein